MYPDDKISQNKILDLTSQEDGEGGGEQCPSYICDHCEIPMQKAEEDLLSGKEVKDTASIIALVE